MAAKRKTKTPWETFWEKLCAAGERLSRGFVFQAGCTTDTARAADQRLDDAATAFLADETKLSEAMKAVQRWEKVWLAIGQKKPRSRPP
jgi:hypothetical protein